MDRFSASILDRPLQWAGAICALSITAVVASVILLEVRPAIQQWGAIPGEIGELRAAAQTVPAQITGQVLAVAQLEIRHATDSLDKRIGQGLKSANARVDQAVSAANARMGDAIGAANQRLMEVTATADGLRSDLKPTLTNSAALVKDAQDSLDDLYPDLKATVESADVAVTSVAMAARTVNAAVPEVAENLKQASEESVRASKATAQLMEHLALATKPLPRWVRYPLAVAGLVAPVAAGAFGAAAAVGAFQ